MKIIFVVTCCALLGFFQGCGRKQKNIFNFPEKESIKINRVLLPPVKGLIITEEKKGNLISWRSIDLPAVYGPGKHPVIFNGYNVYRLVKGRFVPKAPINKKPIKDTSFLDRTARASVHHHAYLVRAVFTIDDQIVQGVASQIVCAD